MHNLNTRFLSLFSSSSYIEIWHRDWDNRLRVVAFNAFFFAEHESSTRKSEKWSEKKLLTI